MQRRSSRLLFKRKETWKPNLDILEGIITRKYEKSYDNRPSSTKNWIRCFRGTHYFEIRNYYIASVSVLLESHIDTSEILSDEVFLSYL